MSGLIFALLTCSASAANPDWTQLRWGEALPAGAEEVHDLPWAGAPGERCVEHGGYILCADAGGLKHAHRPYAVAVEAGERTWLQTAGFEWSSGYRVQRPAPPGLQLEVWGSRAAPFRGWESAWLGEARPQPAVTPDVAPRPVTLSGADALGEARPGVERALARCGGASAQQLPIAVLYDPTGEARMVRLQGFPPEGVDMACVASALGAPRLHPEGGVIELTLTLGPAPPPLTGG